MIPNPAVPLLLLILSFLGLILLLLAPIIIEIKKPQNKGPRKIAEGATRKPYTYDYQQAKSSKQNLPKNLQHVLIELEGKEISAIGVDAVRIKGDVKFPTDIEVQKRHRG